MKLVGTSLDNCLTKVLEQSQDGIVISDPNQQNNPIIFVNESTCKIFEYEESDFLGKNCRFLQANDTKQPEIKQISQAIQERKAITTTLRNYTKTGRLVYNQFTISPIFDKENDLRYFLGVQRDITTEILLRQENDKLQEDQVNNALYCAVSKLYGGLSHEINTPLTIINGHLEILKHTIVSSFEQDGEKNQIINDFQVIEDNLQKIQNITESIREAADSEEFVIEDINLYRALVIALRLVYNRAKSITKIKLLDQIFDLDIDRAKEKIMIQGDYRKLEYVFIIIINNALDQLELQGRDITQNLINIDIIQCDNQYKVVFQDNGGGIEEGLLKEILKPFTSNKAHKGLGIGLSLVKKILSKHQFDIDIQNSNGGAEVTISIPYKS